jgi:DNA-binding transcriptional ArsR family regulator
MMDSLLSPLVSSGTRVRLLLRFFANPGRSAYLRALAGEYDLSPNAVREELSRLSQARLLTSHRQGREIHYQANTEHPLFGELVSMVKKALGIDKVVDNIIDQLGELELALLIDDYAMGRDSGIIDLVLVGRIQQKRLAGLVSLTEGYIKRKIRTLCLTPEEYRGLAGNLLERPHLVLWQAEGAQLPGGQAAAPGVKMGLSSAGKGTQA